MEIEDKIYKNGQGKNDSVFVKNYFSLEAVSPVKNSDLTVNSTHSQSSVSFAPNKSITTPDTSENLENFIDSDFDRIHSATPTICHVKTPSLQTNGTNCNCPSVNNNYLADGIFWQEGILYLRRELEKKQKQKSINNLTFYVVTITMKPKNNFFFIKTLPKKKL